jgi:hypothetical protein
VKFTEETTAPASKAMGKEVANFYQLPVGDALIGGTIGLAGDHHMDNLENALSGKIDMDSLMGSDFKKPNFVTAMQDMGSISPTGLTCASPIGLNANFNLPDSMLQAA